LTRRNASLALGEPLPQLELVETLGSPLATHIKYRVVK
jgi:hypothetical protein